MFITRTWDNRYVKGVPKTTIAEIWHNLKYLLDLLGDQPKHRTEWTLAARKHNISTNQFDYLLDYMLGHEYVKRLGRGEYKRTEKGKAQTELL